jgi:hypothetical protein
VFRSAENHGRFDIYIDGNLDSLDPKRVQMASLLQGNVTVLAKWLDWNT